MKMIFHLTQFFQEVFMALKLSELEGVTAQIAEALKSEGLNNSDQLLAAAGQPKARSELASKLGIEERALLELANRADLARIKGIGKVYSDLLEFAGVDTVMELRTRNPENLFNKINEISAEHQVRSTPRLEDIKDWIAQAKELERAIHY
jgi:predicted flap endonuclease-1-like 5' DNA nuclease